LKERLFNDWLFAGYKRCLILMSGGEFEFRVPPLGGVLNFSDKEPVWKFLKIAESDKFNSVG